MTSDLTVPAKARAPKARRPRRKRKRWLLRLSLVVLLVLVVLVVLAFLAAPLLHARSQAKAAEADLQSANAALRAHHLGPARKEIKSARRHIRSAHGDAEGFGAGVLSHVPVFGGAVDDGRHLIDALDQATVVAKLGVGVYARATGPQSHLVRGTTINLADLRGLSTVVDRIGPHLTWAQADIAAVHGNTPFIGPKIAALRDSAASQVSTVQASYDRYHPLLQQLPAVFGAHGPRSYLIAILNPAEERYSGGATLSLSTVRFDNGRVTFGQSYTVADLDANQQFLNWPRVKGNGFHHQGPQRLTAATFSPYWQVSGAELTRAWQAQTGDHVDGMFAVDLSGLADLFRITGPMQVAGYGQLTADNLVHAMVGSYDTYTDPTQRHALNAAIIPAFRQKLLTGGEFVQKGQSLLSSAKGRHVAAFFDDKSTEQAFVTIGFGGNLSPSPNDYLGVFSQNQNGSKADYWQERTVSTVVSLRANGTAHETTSVQIANPAPAYTGPPPDPKLGYFTRWLGLSLGMFFPQHTQLQTVSVNGRPDTSIRLNSLHVAQVYNRPFFSRSMTLAPGATAQLRATYRVPSAATVSPDGSMSYLLALDPQDVVVAQTNQVTLRIPAGYHFGALPLAWSQRDAQTAVLPATPLTLSVSYDVPVIKN